MKKAFAPISLPGFVLADSDESVDTEDHNIEEESGMNMKITIKICHLMCYN